MAGISRTNSPMNLYRDDYLDTKEELDKAREAIIDEQSQKPSFVVGSIERVNERIANLDRELQMFASSLVIESQESNIEEDYFFPSADDRNGPVKARDVKELDQFAGIYSVKSTLIADPSTKGKYLAKRIKTSKKKKETKATKPKLVELYQFRGFDDKRLTPLPEVDSALTILERVTAAQTSLDRKPQYKEEFKRLFHSKMSEAVLVDSFWWFFLNRYHPSKMVQPKLFNRIAHNYVKLLLSANHPKYRDVFFQSYADNLAQGMYAAFCAAFPDSWRQFQGDFIANICDLTSLWVVGTKPAPGSWQKWNFEKLEPKDLRKGELIKQDSKKGTLYDKLKSKRRLIINCNEGLHLSKTYVPEEALMFSYGNLLNLDFSASDVLHGNDGMSSVVPSEFDLSHKDSKTDRRAKVVSPSNTSISSSVMRDHRTVSQQEVDHGSIDIVAQAQLSGSDIFSDKEKQKVAKGTSLQPIQEQDLEDVQTPVSTSCTRNPKVYKRGTEKKMQSKNAKQVGIPSSKSNSYHKGVPLKSALKSASVDRSSQSSFPHKSSSNVGVSQMRKTKQSHPATDGPTFAKCVFNVSGQSPLVKHFLQKKGLEKRAGIDFFLQRTEIDKLPPPDSQTYQDIIHDSFQSVRLLDENYKQMYEDGVKEHTHFIKMQKQQLKEHMRRENSLMAHPREVKRLSDLLVLELLKDPDEVNTGAAQAVEEALLQQDRVSP